MPCRSHLARQPRRALHVIRTVAFLILLLVGGLAVTIWNVEDQATQSLEPNEPQQPAGLAV